MELVVARAKRKLTQWRLRQLTGIHQTKISLIENGYVSPTSEEKVALARALGLDVTDIDWPANEISKRVFAREEGFGQTS